MGCRRKASEFSHHRASALTVVVSLAQPRSRPLHRPQETLHMNILCVWSFSYSPRDQMDGEKPPSPPHVTLVWTPGCSHGDGICPPAHSAQGPLSRALSADPTLSYQEGGLPLSWVCHTDLLLASVEIEATVTLSIPLNCQLHLLECDCSPVQPAEAPASHSALGPGSSISSV